MQTNEKQYYIYLRSTRERVPCTKEEFDNYYRDIDTFRKMQQRRGRCVCPAAKRLDCDMDCVTCPFKRQGELVSLDCVVAENGDKETFWADEIPDSGPTVCESIEEKELIVKLRLVLSQLSVDEQALCQAVMDDLSERSAATRLNISRKAFTCRRDKLFSQLKKILSDFV